jgi:hypothetical protein
MNLDNLIAEIVARTKALGINCDQQTAQELAESMREAYEEAAQDLAIEILMQSTQEVRASMA